MFSQVVVIWYARILDRRNFHSVMQHLPPRAQHLVGQRLGWIHFVDFERPRMCYKLRLEDKADCEVTLRDSLC